MGFPDTDEHRLIRDSVRKVCADFPDEYWAEKDEAHEFPWDFYHAMAAGVGTVRTMQRNGRLFPVATGAAP